MSRPKSIYVVSMYSFFYFHFLYSKYNLIKTDTIAFLHMF